MQDRWQAPSEDGIRDRSSDAANRRIDRTTRGAIAEASASPERLRARLAELDREWDLDRALMLNFAILGGLSGALTMRSIGRRGTLGGWGLLFFTQIGFLGHHALRRWCPPMPVFRRLGFRSAREIAAERQALRAQLDEHETR